MAIFRLLSNKKIGNIGEKSLKKKGHDSCQPSAGSCRGRFHSVWLEVAVLRPLSFKGVTNCNTIYYIHSPRLRLGGGLRLGGDGTLVREDKLL